MNTNIINLILCALLLIPCGCSKEPVEPEYRPTTEIGEKLLQNGDQIAKIFTDTTFMVTVGVEHTHLHLQTMSGYVQQVHITKADLNTPGLKVKVAMPNNSNDISSGWSKQTLTKMATFMSKPRERVVAMTNGDYWNTTEPINPRGPVHRGGTIISDKWDYDPRLEQQALSFVAVTNQGKMYIDDRIAYNDCKKDLKECTGAGIVLLKDGKIRDLPYPQRDPRTSIGYTADGILYMMTVDGRQKFGAAGMTYLEMADIFFSLGCEAATTLDGGGSAQMLIRHPVANIFQIRNRPADGKERPVVNGWAIIVDEP